ncbi:MAG: ion transporter [Leucobacter sp.]|nr:ion transporter [Leucobacter sp.]
MHSGGQRSADPRGVLRARVRRFVEDPRFQGVMIALIVLNAIILGVETYHPEDEFAESILAATNSVIVLLFAIEIVLRVYAHGWGFFTDPWNVFDFIVVLAALVPAGTTSSALRLFRVLRLFRLISTVRAMRLVVNAIGASMSGIAVIGALFAVVLYVFAIASTTLFGSRDPESFGDLGITFVSLYRLVMGDGWPDIVQPLASGHPWIWAYFVGFTLLGSVMLLNLFIAVIVEAMERAKERERGIGERARAGSGETAGLMHELRSMREQLVRIEDRLRAAGDFDNAGPVGEAKPAAGPMPDGSESPGE